MKSNSADKFFCEEDRLRISDTIRSIEERTIGEVAVMAVESSDDYAEADIMGGVLLGSLSAFLCTFFFFHSSLWFYVPLSFVLSFVFLQVFRKVPSLKLAFIGIKRKEDAVRQRAVRAFYEKGLYRTKANTGVLFFISLLEHKVWVLADRGIYEKIDRETLHKFSTTVSRGIAEGRACEALCSAMKEAGELLARHFPMQHGDVNELSNELMTD